MYYSIVQLGGKYQVWRTYSALGLKNQITPTSTSNINQIIMIMGLNLSICITLRSFQIHKIFLHTSYTTGLLN